MLRIGPVWSGLTAAAVLLMVSACSSGTDLRSVASQALGAEEGKLFFDDQINLGPSACSLAPVWDTESTNPYPLVFAVLEDGTVIEGFSDDAAQQVLNTCFFDAGLEPDAKTMAKIIVDLARTPGPIAIAEPDAQQRLEERGITYAAPALTKDGATTTVRFLAIELEIDTVYRATATAAATGALTTSFEEISE